MNEIPEEEEQTTTPIIPDLSIKVDVSKPSDMGINESETVGFTISPVALSEFLNMASLPKEKERVFPKLVLNFDKADEKVWYGNKAIGSSLINGGFATYSFFTNCWGNGQVAISAAMLSGYVNQLRAYKEVTFWANLKTKIFGIQAGTVDLFTNFLENPTEIKSASPAFPFKQFDADYVAILKDEEKQLIYGGEIESSELQMIIKRASGFSITQYPFTISSSGIEVSINDIYKPTDKGANKKKIITKPESARLPTDNTTIVHKVGELIIGPARNCRGVITIRFPKVVDSPIYIVKKNKADSGGIHVAAALIGTKSSAKTGK